MKLSEALMLSTQYKLDPYHWSCDDGGCLLHNAGLAAGENITGEYVARTVWPWTSIPVPIPAHLTTKCKELSHVHETHLNYRSLDVIQWLAKPVRNGEITIEEVADWVRSIEPEEEHDEGAGGNEGDRVVPAREEAGAETLAGSKR